ncbi:hypothetical protein FNV43_RR13044 [Rhamnella rubrinervis]|uniref:Uncharacterized protein n=1 Tax=Rhamnella rubrinervis TaxID=2594499 RepID=A0A8K0MEM1_9ROSA|nr:hypothetical protein FNV43_RR13044 [Rhamnella rubrinervis]
MDVVHLDSPQASPLLADKEWVWSVNSERPPLVQIGHCPLPSSTSSEPLECGFAVERLIVASWRQTSQLKASGCTGFLRACHGSHLKASGLQKAQDFSSHSGFGLLQPKSLLNFNCAGLVLELSVVYVVNGITNQVIAQKAVVGGNNYTGNYGHYAQILVDVDLAGKKPPKDGSHANKKENKAPSLNQVYKSKQTPLIHVESSIPFVHTTNTFEGNINTKMGIKVRPSAPDLGAAPNRIDFNTEVGKSVRNLENVRTSTHYNSMIPRQFTLWVSAFGDSDDEIDDYEDDGVEDKWLALQGDSSSKPSKEIECFPNASQQSNSMAMVPVPIDSSDDRVEDEWPSLQGEGSLKHSKEFDGMPNVGHQSNVMAMVSFPLASPGVKHSFVSKKFTSKLEVELVKFDCGLFVATPSSVGMCASFVLKSCELSMNRAIIDCKEKIFLSSPINGPYFVFKRLKVRPLPSELYDKELDSCGLKDIKAVQDFLNFFPEELSELPQDSEVEFTIDVVPRTVPI